MKQQEALNGIDDNSQRLVESVLPDLGVQLFTADDQGDIHQWGDEKESNQF